MCFFSIFIWFFCAIPSKREFSGETSRIYRFSSKESVLRGLVWGEVAFFLLFICLAATVDLVTSQSTQRLARSPWTGLDPLHLGRQKKNGRFEFRGVFGYVGFGVETFLGSRIRRRFPFADGTLPTRYPSRCGSSMTTEILFQLTLLLYPSHARSFTGASAHNFAQRNQTKHDYQLIEFKNDVFYNYFSFTEGSATLSKLFFLYCGQIWMGTAGIFFLGRHHPCCKVIYLPEPNRSFNMNGRCFKQINTRSMRA